MLHIQALGRLPSWRSILIRIALYVGAFPFHTHSCMFIIELVPLGNHSWTTGFVLVHTWIGQAFFQYGDMGINIPIRSTS